MLTTIYYHSGNKEKKLTACIVMALSSALLNIILGIQFDKLANFSSHVVAHIFFLLAIATKAV